MKASFRRRVGMPLATIVATAFVLVVAAPLPASATFCAGPLGANPVTVGAGGQPVFTSPEVHVDACYDTEGDMTLLPTPRVVTCCSTVPSRVYVFLDMPYGGLSEVSATISYSFDGDETDKTVTVPLGGSDGSSTCVFYRGPASYNPGGCLAYVET